MKKIPFIAIGAGELDENKPIGKTIKCKNCGKRHIIQYGEEVLPSGKKKLSKFLAFVKCENKEFLVGVNGKQL